MSRSLIGWVVLFSILVSACAQTCKTYTFSDNKKKYTTCNDLPVLNSYLHWTYNKQTSTVDLAYRHLGITSSRWIAWAINPTGTGMIGSQALVAYQNSGGIMRAYTSPVASFTTRLQEGNLSFEVPNISSEFANDEMIIYATLVLPKNVTSVNHVWQEGPVDGDSLGIHALSGGNVMSMGTLDLLSGQAAATKGGVLQLKKVHGVINMVSWTLMPIGAMIARYMKVFKSADPLWFHLHRGCQSSAYILGIFGGATTGLILGSKSHGIQYDAHRNIAIALFVLGLLQIAAIWRPKKASKYRIYWTIFHHSSGYAMIILSIINIYKGLNMLQPGKIWKELYTAILICLGSIALVLEATTWYLVIKRRKANIETQQA